MRSLLSSSAALAVLAFTATAAAAQITPGSQLTFSGTYDATDIGTPGVVLDFGNRVLADASANTGSFASLNRANGPGVSGPLQSIRVGNGPQYIANVLVLGGYRFTLNAVPSGRYGQDACYVEPDVAQQCTPFQSALGEFPATGSLSPFYLVNTASTDPNAPITSIAAFDLIGTVTAPGGATSNFTGTIRSTFAGESYQEVLETLQDYGLQGLPFTGTFVAHDANVAEVPSAVVPEPATCALVAAGLAGAAAVARRRRV